MRKKRRRFGCLQDKSLNKSFKLKGFRKYHKSHIEEPEQAVVHKKRHDQLDNFLAYAQHTAGPTDELIFCTTCQLPALES